MITDQDRPPSLLLIVATAVLAGLHAGLTFAMRLAEGKSASFALGAATAMGIAVPLSWLLLSQIVPRFRNARNRYLVVLVVSLLLLSDRGIRAKHELSFRALALRPSGSPSNAPGLHFMALPETSWVSEDLSPPNRYISTKRVFDHVDGTKEIIVSLMKNPEREANPLIALLPVKDALSRKGVRFSEDELFMIGHIPTAKLVGDIGAGQEKRHMLQLLAVSETAIYSIQMISTTGPVEKDKELATWIKSLRIND